MTARPSRALGSPGELAIVLHTHMPYVEGYGTWPFGEEWLWEAVATSYLPLIDVLDRAAAASPSGQSPVTLSLTPVLCDQLEAPGALERCLDFLRTVRPASHALDRAEHAADPALVAEIDRSAAEYAARADRLEELGAAGLLDALGAHATWTSSATHAILPLLCTEAGIELQLATGIASHRRRFGAHRPWHGGLWLPECAHAEWLHAALEETGVRSTCVELTRAFGAGDPRHLHPLQTDDGPVLWPIDRAMIDLAWGRDGYPSQPAYRAYDRTTARDHRLWAGDASPYDPARAAAALRADARDFVARVTQRVADGGVCVCAFDTELFGHWWYEGVDWLAAVLDEAAAQGLALTTLDDALERHATVAAPAELSPSSWGEAGDLRTWSAPKVAVFAWRLRDAELRVLAAPRRPSDRALRELLALQASDWAFIAYRGWAGDYPEQRAAGHLAALERALDPDAGSAGGEESLDEQVRNLAPVLVRG